MAAVRFVLLLASWHLAGCGYASFRGSITVSSQPANLRSVGAFSPDGSHFAVAESALSPSRAATTLFRIFARGPTPDVPDQWRLLSSVRLSKLFAVDLAFSRDGRLVALAGVGHTHTVVLWEVHRRRVVRSLPGSGTLTQTVAFAPDGSWLLTAGIDGRLRVWDVASGALRTELQDSPGLLRQARFPVAVGPAGAFVVYPRTDGRISFADPRTGLLLETRPTGGREVYDLALSATGRWLAVATDAGSVLWDLERPGSSAQRLGVERSPSLAFFPDGGTLLLSAQTPQLSRVVEVPTGRILYAFANSGAPAHNPPLGAAVDTPVGLREHALWQRLLRSFPGAGAQPVLQALLLSYARFPSIHRVAISPENLWVAFFEGGGAGLVITERHYLLRLRRTLEKAAPPPLPARPLTPAERRRLQESI